MNDFDAHAHDYERVLNRGLRVSGEVHTYFARGRIAWLARCVQKLSWDPRIVLDFGCGTGSATPFLVELLGARAVIGVDSSAESLEIARRKNGALPAEYILAGQYRPCGTIDLVFCNGVFHHVPLAERPDVARSIAESLRPGGVLALWENNPWNPGTRYVMSQIPFDRGAILLTPSQTRTLVRSAGLEVLSTDHHFVFPAALKALRWTESYLTHVPIGAQYQVLSRKTQGNAAGHGA
jgi:SAM-dependent methyltransferase